MLTIGTVHVASNPIERAIGLLGRDHFDGVFALPHTRQVHTFGMRFAIDVCWLDHAGFIVRQEVLTPGRLSRWVPDGDVILEASVGHFARLGVQPGDQLAWDQTNWGHGHWSFDRRGNPNRQSRRHLAASCRNLGHR